MFLDSRITNNFLAREVDVNRIYTNLHDIIHMSTIYKINANLTHSSVFICYRAHNTFSNIISRFSVRYKLISQASLGQKGSPKPAVSIAMQIKPGEDSWRQNNSS